MIKRVINTGALLVCMFYVLGTCNVLVLESLHEVAHIFAPQTHSHSYTFGHKILNYDSLKGMAGNSHYALLELKKLLEANKKNKEEPETTYNLKIDKHISEELSLRNMYCFSRNKKIECAYYVLYVHRYPNINSPPPKFI